jgi:hypothetical protein
VSKGQPFNAAKPLHRFKLPLSDKGQQVPMEVPGALEEMAGIAIRKHLKSEGSRKGRAFQRVLFNEYRTASCLFL